MSSNRALSDGELAGLFDYLSGFRTLVAAASGGADSLALCVGLARWRDLRGGDAPRLIAITIDHGLRPESSAEAERVGALVRPLGLDHTIVPWTGEKPATAIQATARGARYRLLVDAARAELQPAAIVTAHHADDQAETLIMRLARGSGVDGLAGMAGERDEDGMPIVRPLLSVPKSRLVATLMARRLQWVEDPSNANSAFERVRLRGQWPALETSGLTTDMLALSARRLGRARQALEVSASELAGRVLDLHDGAFATIARSAWREAPEELRIRVLEVAIAAMGGQGEPPELAQVEDLAAALAAHGARGVSLGGCLIEPGIGSIAIYREPGRDGLPSLRVQPGVPLIWDRRFEVGCAAGHTRALEVGPLGGAAYARLRRGMKPKSPMPALAARTLPSFWSGETLLGVPHLGFEEAAASRDLGLYVRFVSPQGSRHSGIR